MNYIGDILDQIPVVQPDIQSAGIGSGTIESLQGTVRNFTLGEFMIAEMNIVLIDMSSINQLYRTVSDKSIWGLIGSDFLLKYKARIDYGKRILTLRIH